MFQGPDRGDGLVNPLIARAPGFRVQLKCQLVINNCDYSPDTGDLRGDEDVTSASAFPANGFDGVPEVIR